MSAILPGVSVIATGRPRSSARQWILQVRPPRERPIASSYSPFLRLPPRDAPSHECYRLTVPWAPARMRRSSQTGVARCLVATSDYNDCRSSSVDRRPQAHRASGILSSEYAICLRSPCGHQLSVSQACHAEDAFQSPPKPHPIAKTDDATSHDRSGTDTNGQ